MLQQYSIKLPQESEIVKPNSHSPKKIIECINSYAEMTNKKEFAVDISYLNVIDACYISTMCSTNHYIKHPDGKINWLVSSEMVENFANRLSLGNSDYIPC